MVQDLTVQSKTVTSGQQIAFPFELIPDAAALQNAQSELDALFGGGDGAADVSVSVRENSQGEQIASAILPHAAQLLADDSELASANAGSNEEEASPLEQPPASHVPSAEWDHRGRVVRARFTCGNTAQYRYDAEDRLYGFIYARLAWSLKDRIWIARDTNFQWVLEATVTVNSDGTLRIAKRDVVRSLKLDGSRLDEYKNGTKLLSHRINRIASPADLLAVSKPLTSGYEMPDLSEGPGSSDLVVMTVDQSGEISKSGQLRKISLDPLKANLEPSGCQASLERLRVFDENDSSPPVRSLKDRLLESLTLLAISAIERGYGEEHRLLTSHLDRLAEIRKDQRHIDESERLHQRSLHIKRLQFGREHELLGVNHHGLAAIHHELGRHRDSVKDYTEAIRLFENALAKYKVFLASQACSKKDFTVLLERLLKSIEALGRLHLETQAADVCLDDLRIRAQRAWSIVQPAENRFLSQLYETIVSRQA